MNSQGYLIILLTTPKIQQSKYETWCGISLGYTYKGTDVLHTSDYDNWLWKKNAHLEMGFHN